MRPAVLVIAILVGGGAAAGLTWLGFDQGSSPKPAAEQLVQGAAIYAANCAACHRSIDPLGLAFEQFDAIGQVRTRERVENGTGSDPLIDASGVLPDGRTFTNASDFKQLLLADRDLFLTAFVEHLCTYALRRVLTVDDRPAVQAIVETAKADGASLRDIVRAVALSDLLKTR